MSWRIFPNVGNMTSFVSQRPLEEDIAASREQLLDLQAMEEGLQETRRRQQSSDAATGGVIAELNRASRDMDRRYEEGLRGIATRVRELEAENERLRTETVRVERVVTDLRDRLGSLEVRSVKPWHESLPRDSILYSKLALVVEKAGVDLSGFPTLVAESTGTFVRSDLVRELSGGTNLLLLVKLPGDRVVGGLTKVPWPAHWSADDESRSSFIFSLDDPFA
jgi:hypothetical protein